MHFKRIIAAWAILALAFAQLAIAQHNAVHLDNSYTEIQAQDHADAHHEHGGETPPSQHNCPECLLVKSLQAAFYVDSALHVDFTLYQQALPISETLLLSQTTTSAYNPRAPPVLLI